METNEINVTEETKNVVEEVAKAKSNKGVWIAVGAAVVTGLTWLGFEIAKRKKAKKAEKENAKGDENWTDELESTVKEIKDENID